MPPARSSPLTDVVRHAPAVLLASVPLALLQTLFARMARHVAQSRAELFNRLGPHAGKRFLIDHLAFVLLPVPAGVRPAFILATASPRGANGSGPKRPAR
jgi:hypothetical protein